MMKNNFSKNLKYLLDSEKISVKTIINITDINSPGLITMWKNGERQITTKDLVAIANYLNYTVDDLINKDLSKEENMQLNEIDVLYKNSKELLNEYELDMMKHLCNELLIGMNKIKIKEVRKKVEYWKLEKN